MRRRTWLKAGVIGGALLALGGTLVVLARPGWRDGRLTDDGRALFGAVAVAVLDALLPGEASARRAALAAHLERVEATVAGLPPGMQAEVAQLSALLLHPAGRFALTGLATDWAGVEPRAMQDALQGLRASRLELKQQVFHALRDLTNGAWFADPAAWTAIGYPGPRAIEV
jgi:hypothetical protein